MVDSVITLSAVLRRPLFKTDIAVNHSDLFEVCLKLIKVTALCLNNVALNLVILCVTFPAFDLFK